MPGYGPKYYSCILCNKRTKPEERRSVNKEARRILHKKFLIECTEGGVLCRKCRNKCDNLRHTEKTCVEVCSTPNQSPVGKNSKGVIKSPPSVILPLQSTVRSHAYCVLCRRPGPKLVVVSTQTRFSFFLEKNILIPAGIIIFSHVYNKINNMMISNAFNYNLELLKSIMQLLI